MREQLVGDAHVGALLVDLAHRDQSQAIFGLFDIDDGTVEIAQNLRHRHVAPGGGAAELLAVGLGGILVLEEAMQIRGVRGIDADFERLQPVAVDVALEGKGVAVGRDKAIDLGKGGRGALAEIGPENPALLEHGIGALLDALAQRRALRLRRCLQALARDVKQPAVKGAAQAALLEPAEGKVGAAMRAVAFDQAVAAFFVAKQHQILAEQFYRLDRPWALELVDQRRRLPIHPHQFPAGVFGPGAGDQVVLLLAHHGGASFRARAREFAAVKLLGRWFPARDFLAAPAPIVNVVAKKEGSNLVRRIGTIGASGRKPAEAACRN